MPAREFTELPRMAPLYVRAAAALVPGASRLPGVPGAAGEMPQLELVLRAGPADPERLARYRDVCGFVDAGPLPPTFLHLLAFPLHMTLMCDSRFPFSPVGLVHIENEITQLRALAPGESPTITVRAGAVEAHARGRVFALLSAAHVGEELVWQERSTMLRRGGHGQRDDTGTNGAPGASVAQGGPGASAAPGAPDDPAASGARSGESWSVPEDTGRRFAAVSGDRNPIHMHALAARAFGFPRAIAHGMWSKARCLAALHDELPAAFTVAVSFRKPILLPASVRLESARDQDGIAFTLRAAGSDAVHLQGNVGAPAHETVAS